MSPPLTPLQSDGELFILRPTPTPLQCTPDQMLLDNRQLVAANHDAVVVLQLVKEVRGEGREGQWVSSGA